MNLFQQRADDGRQRNPQMLGYAGLRFGRNMSLLNRVTAMAMDVELVDRLHDLREVLHLIEMAAQAIEAADDRGAIQRAVLLGTGLLDDLKESIEPRIVTEASGLSVKAK